jgi:hypothetical protein
MSLGDSATPAANMSTTIGIFMPLLCNYLPLPINHHTTAFLQLLGTLHKQP